MKYKVKNFDLWDTMIYYKVVKKMCYWWRYDKYPETDPDTWDTLYMKVVLQIRREAIDYLINGSGTIVYKHANDI